MIQYIPSGDSAFIVKTGIDISVETNGDVRKLLHLIENENIGGIIDYIPSYNELMICYDPSIIGYKKLLKILRSLAARLEEIELPESAVIHVPVLYGGEYGPDLQEVADHNHLKIEEVINIHHSATYLIYMIGFTPGFCYLGGMDQRIATPRKKTPRLEIPAGSIGIAGVQTGIYSIVSPGGWQLIGQTPLRLFDPAIKPEFSFEAGDLIKFYPVSEGEFNGIEKDVIEGVYKVTRKNRV